MSTAAPREIGAGTQSEVAADEPARDRAGWWLAGTVAAALLLTVLATRWTFDTWTWFNDEYLFRSIGTWVVSDLPGSLIQLQGYQRGVQRLSVWLLAFGVDWFGSDGFRVIRWITVLSWGSTVIPVWLLARQAGARPVWATLGALLAIVIPWAGYSGTALTEPLAYPLFAWACLAIWLAAVKPGVRHDVLALVAIGAAMLARTGMVLLVVALAVVVGGQELRLLFAAGATRQGAVAACRRHAVLLGAAALALLVAVVGGASTLQGSWYAGAGIGLRAIYGTIVGVLAPLASGMWFVPVIAALALAVAEICRPTDPRRLALGLLVAGALLTMVLTLAAGPYEERYFFYAAAPCAAALAVAASRRETPLWAVSLAAVSVVAVITFVPWAGNRPVSDYLVYPANFFGARVMREGLDARLPHALQMDGTQLVVLLIAGAGLVTALLASPLRPAGRWGRAAAPVGVVLGVLLLFAAIGQTSWGMRKYVAGGGGGASLSERTALGHIAGNRHVGLWLPPSYGGPSLMVTWQDLEYYNPQVTEHDRVDSSQDAAPLATTKVRVLRVDPRTGAVLQTGGGPALLPPLMAVAPAQVTAPLRGRTVARRGAIALVAPARPASVRWELFGIQSDGWMGDRPGSARVFRVPPRACLLLRLTGPGPGPTTVRLDGAGPARRVVLRGARPREVRVPLTAGSAADVTVSSTGPRTTLPDTRVVRLNVIPRGLRPCAGG